MAESSQTWAAFVGGLLDAKANLLLAVFVLVFGFQVVAGDQAAFAGVFGIVVVFKAVALACGSHKAKEGDTDDASLARTRVAYLLNLFTLLVGAWAFLFNLLSDPDAVQANPGLLLSDPLEFVAGLLRWSLLGLANLQLARHAELLLYTGSPFNGM